MRAILILAVTIGLSGAPANAQDTNGLAVEPPIDQPTQPQTRRPGRTTDSAVGEVGVRQERERADGVNPMARIDNRIRNRIEARISNRIDRDYDPRADATSPFESADNETQRAGRSSARRP